MFRLSTSDRLGHWKKFRSEIGSLPLLEAIGVTQDFWQPCPFTPFYLDIDDSKNWPDPWQLITENYYCDIAKALGIVYTLHLSKHGAKLESEVRVYYDPTTRLTYNVAWFDDGKYVVNLTEGAVVNKEHINQRLKLKHRFTATDLKLNQY
jgi:hypothetical protein